jgi:hypothetical protein
MVERHGFLPLKALAFFKKMPGLAAATVARTGIFFRKATSFLYLPV